MSGGKDIARGLPGRALSDTTICHACTDSACLTRCPLLCRKARQTPWSSRIATVCGNSEVSANSAPADDKPLWAARAGPSAAGPGCGIVSHPQMRFPFPCPSSICCPALRFSTGCRARGFTRQARTRCPTAPSPLWCDTPNGSRARGHPAARLICRPEKFPTA